MKIIHILESFSAGVFDFVADLTRTLDQHEYTVIHGMKSDTPVDYKRRFKPNTRFIPWKHAQREISLIKDIKALLFLVRTLKKEVDSDIIHLHSSKAGLMGRMAAFLLRKSKKVIYTSHAVSFLRTDVSKLKHKLFVLLEKAGAWCGGTVIACSRSEQKEFMKNGINADLILNGIKMPELLNKKDPEKLNKQLTIGTMGRISAQKNPELFNTIAKSFQNKGIKFTWIGDGEERAYIDEDFTFVTGWVSREKATEYLQSVDIYLSTSLWEGLPLSVLQAMAMGKPLLLSDCVGNRDLVFSEQNGFLFKTADNAVAVINKIMNNRDGLTQYGDKSYTIVKDQFNIESTYHHYNEWYHKLTEKQ